MPKFCPFIYHVCIPKLFGLKFQLLAGADSTWLLALDLKNDPSKYAYLSMGGEACKCTPEDKKMYKEVQRAMGVR